MRSSLSTYWKECTMKIDDLVFVGLNGYVVAMDRKMAK